MAKVKKGDWKDLVCTVGVEVVESLGEIPKNKKSSVVPKRRPLKESFIKKQKHHHIKLDGEHTKKCMTTV